MCSCTGSQKVTLSPLIADTHSPSHSNVQKLAKTARLDGFRPGKVPLKVLQQRFGGSVRQEVVHEIMRNKLYEAFKQEEITPAGAPFLEPTENKTDV